MCQTNSSFVIHVESSAFKLFSDVCRTSILALRELSIKLVQNMSKYADNENRQKVTKIGRFVEKKAIL